MITTRGIITKVQPYRDNHLIINIYSKDHGKKSLIIFGGQSKKKRSTVAVGSINIFEFDKDSNVCKVNDIDLMHNWFMYNKFQLKLIDYVCYLIDKLLFLEDDLSMVIQSYENLIEKLNNKQPYILSFFFLELNILKSAGYEPNLSYDIISKILPVKKYKDQNLSMIFDLVESNKDFQLIFFDFLGKVVERVMQNINMKLPKITLKLFF